MLMFLYIIGIVCVVGLLAIVLYADRQNRRERMITVRRKALKDAENALQSLAWAARRAFSTDRNATQEAKTRAYLYERSAQIVASIPVDRL